MGRTEACGAAHRPDGDLLMPKKDIKVGSVLKYEVGPTPYAVVVVIGKWNTTGQEGPSSEHIWMVEAKTKADALTAYRNLTEEQKKPRSRGGLLYTSSLHSWSDKFVVEEPSEEVFNLLDDQ